MRIRDIINKARDQKLDISWVEPGFLFGLTTQSRLSPCRL
jgi:hypothetical protein